MSYVFHRSSVLMMRSTGGVAPSSIADATCVPMGVSTLLGDSRPREKGEMGKWENRLDSPFPLLPFSPFPLFRCYDGFGLPPAGAELSTFTLVLFFKVRRT